VFDKLKKIFYWLKNEELIDFTLHEYQLKQKKELACKEEFNAFENLASGSSRKLPLEWEDRYLCFDDKTTETGFDRHYIYHPAWAARVLAKSRPSEHVDISSTIEFSTLISAFLPVRFFDFRPAFIHLSGLTIDFANLLELPFDDLSISSLSCMHVLEHVGLGRYGDKLDPDGDIKAIKELCRVLSIGGNLLIAVPVGEKRIHFNAHRVYNHENFISYFRGLRLVEFALIPDGEASSGLIFNPLIEQINSQKYACGCYWFTK
jgi:SAM-dependent methyltransferase